MLPSKLGKKSPTTFAPATPGSGASTAASRRSSPHMIPALRSLPTIVVLLQTQPILPSIKLQLQLQHHLLLPLLLLNVMIRLTTLCQIRNNASILPTQAKCDDRCSTTILSGCYKCSTCMSRNSNLITKTTFQHILFYQIFNYINFCFVFAFQIESQIRLGRFSTLFPRQQQRKCAP